MFSSCLPYLIGFLRSHCLKILDRIWFNASFMVNGCVECSIHKFKVIQSIIMLVFVFVVYNLTGKQCSSQMITHDKNMFFDPPTFGSMRVVRTIDTNVTAFCGCTTLQVPSRIFRSVWESVFGFHTKILSDELNDVKLKVQGPAS